VQGYSLTMCGHCFLVLILHARRKFIVCASSIFLPLLTYHFKLRRIQFAALLFAAAQSLSNSLETIFVGTVMVQMDQILLQTVSPSLATIIICSTEVKTRTERRLVIRKIMCGRCCWTRLKGTASWWSERRIMLA
jgi:hypothetical protein